MSKFILIVALAALLVACGSTSVPPTTGEPQSRVSTQATAAPAATAAAKPTDAPKPTAAPEPTAAPTEEPTPEPEQLKVLNTGYGQKDKQLGFAFVIENPNKELAYSSSQYQVSAYGKDDTVLGTEDGYITFVFPGEKLGVAGQIFLNSEDEVAKIDVQVLNGKAEPFKESNGFATDKAKFVPDKYFSKVTGIVTSTYKKDIKQVRVSAVLYDKDDKIIGGGFTFVDFVPAGGKSAIDMSATAAGDVAKVELYPTISSLSLLNK